VHIILIYRYIVAIRLTLCQLEIARFEIPRDCKNMNDYPSDCVVALGKVSQFWATYIGFYREVGQLLLTFNSMQLIELMQRQL